mmetsp:Transcript_25641/g.71659  ORF Transcript_25641/g.71659 Transcript_25641/m.71659 type:complete len:969 (+) Transcript_25641:74-2980(+)
MASISQPGVIHVRVLKAKRLSCSAGSSVKAVLSLPPWKGRVATADVDALVGPRRNGVCAEWDPISDSGLCSMMNEWNGPESPMPSIRVELISSPFGLGVMSMSMGSATLACDSLFRTPRTWESRWCEIESSHGSRSMQLVPQLLVEVMFDPADQDDERSTNSSSSISPFADHATSVQQQKGFDEDKSQATESTSTYLPPMKTHMVKVTSIWAPESCSICHRYIFGRNSANKCEECHLLCCNDCIINFDLKIPCGSDLSKQVRIDSHRAKITLDKIMSTVAPVEKEIVSTKREGETAESETGVDRGFAPVGDGESSIEHPIGKLQLEFTGGCLFDGAYKADTAVDDVVRNVKNEQLRVGDYYIRVVASAGDKENERNHVRTKTNQRETSLEFATSSISIDVQHHFMEYKVEVVDSHNGDTCLGCTRLDGHSVLQLQRDELAAQGSFMTLFQCLRGPQAYNGKRRVIVPIRRNVKSGLGSDFFPESNGKKQGREEQSKKNSSKKKAEGEIVGWMEMMVGLEEYCGKMYDLTHPLVCPTRHPPKASLANFQRQITRLKHVIADIKMIIADFKYVVGWENPRLSAMSFAIFLWSCLYFNMEYVASLPFCLVGLMQIRLAMTRTKGNKQQYLLTRDLEAVKEHAATPLCDGAMYVPFGMLTIGAIRGKSIRSREYGLVGTCACRISMTKQLDSTMDGVGRSQTSTIGYTDGQYTENPAWENLHYNKQSKRMVQLLSILHNSDVIEEFNNEALQFPILQDQKSTNTKGDKMQRSTQASSMITFVPWEESRDAIVFQIQFLDVINSLPGSEDVLGEVTIPLSALAKERSISGWFDVVVRGQGSKAQQTHQQQNEADNEDDANPEQPQLFISMEWSPSTTLSEGPEPMTFEASVIVQEEAAKAAKANMQTKKTIWDTPFVVLNSAISVGDNLQTVQNILSSVLNAIDMVQNLLNFTVSNKMDEGVLSIRVCCVVAS